MQIVIIVKLYNFSKAVVNSKCSAMQLRKLCLIIYKSIHVIQYFEAVPPQENVEKNCLNNQVIRVIRARNTLRQETISWIIHVKLACITCIQADAFRQMQLGRCIQADAFRQMHSCRCIQAVAFRQMHSGRCMQAYAFRQLHSGRCISSVVATDLHQMQMHQLGTSIQADASAQCKQLTCITCIQADASVQYKQLACITCIQAYAFRQMHQLSTIN